MATKKSAITEAEIAERIRQLSETMGSAAEFVKRCGIAHRGLVSELKAGRLKAPGAAILSQVVKGTGCSGTWLLTGQGPMFEHTPVDYDAFRVFTAAVRTGSVPQVEVRLAELLVTLLRERQEDKGKNGSQTH